MNQKTHFTEAGAWAKEHYGFQPVYVSLTRESIYAVEYPEIDDAEEITVWEVSPDLELVADLPSLCDAGALVEEDGLVWMEDPDHLGEYLQEGFIDFESLLNPNDPACQAAIQLTQSAATRDIPSRLLKEANDKGV